MDQTQVLGDHARKPRTHLLRGHRINLRLLDWIWNIRGSVPLAPGQSSDEAFARLDPLFQQPGTTYERTGDTLVFAKKDQAAQDKMSIFDAGALQIEPGAGGAVLRYRMASRALLFCFLAPLLFLAFGQLTVAVGKFAGPDTEAAEKDKKDEKKKDVVRELHPIDKFLGAPAPEKPKDDKKEEKKDHSHSPTAAYVFAAIFAALYAAGRILEDRLIRSLFRKRLHAAEA
ncbi:hypothetical protein [Blastomonas sp.]|uniref:hypothetical protein n=1 Tax=Blastomonas sp. TaxID=1909299 RepID=UPI00345C92C7